MFGVSDRRNRMFERVFGSVFAFFAKHKRLVWAGGGLLIVLCAWGSSRLRFDNDISAMLPGDPALLRDFALIRESAFAGKVVLSFELTGTTASLSTASRRRSPGFMSFSSLSSESKPKPPP